MVHQYSSTVSTTLIVDPSEKMIVTVALTYSPLVAIVYAPVVLTVLTRLFSIGAVPSNANDVAISSV